MAGPELLSRAEVVEHEFDHCGATTDRRTQRVVTLASMIGHMLECYDFMLYGIAAALVFGKLFFSSSDPVTGTLAAFAINAVGFVARPVGAVVCGHYGDRIGRRSLLIITL